MRVDGRESKPVEQVHLAGKHEHSYRQQRGFSGWLAQVWCIVGLCADLACMRVWPVCGRGLCVGVACVRTWLV